ncbi:hypothetical protein GQ43DRAFT_377505 [Delitschia confertaspora ATCC 74209]|uniref:Zona occludens toxin N-terminal domain-containing protein n=1 Tax=Delitschia confertaspora ATCC 74209 TaxID=1513339 RepID=A0A9P4MQ33_9PLEO|nr:hypothetical protein GQ43DRAFT_377505 [Delitschia confertaspora ATCC 74209]
MAPPKSGNELAQYQDVLRPPRDTRTSGSSNLEESRMAPLIWWDVKEYFSRSITNGPQLKPITKTPFSQYAVLGTPEENDSVCADNGTRKPVLLNTNAPWSAFVCGSQGSGKSHALSCMLENCLLTKPDKIKKIGQNVKPLAGLVFHYDSSQSSDVCEAAYLATDVPTTVLVPPSNFGKLADRYNRLNSKYGANIKVKRLHLLPKYLDTARMKSLMAVGDTSRTPLYMQTVTKILRDMATASQGRGDFDYQMFRRMIEQEQFDVRQMGPLQMRLDLLESFMRRNKNGEILANLENDNLRGAPGTLTIIDLTDPVVDSDSAGALFNICLSVFLSQTTAGKIVALDEAHNYMAHTSASAKEFTENLVSSIRQQRHQGVRVVVSTQEPSINPRLLDLCNITMVHRCSSPDWFKTLKQHLGGIFLQQKASSLTLSDSDSEADAGVELTVDDHTLFRKIMRLGLGESLVFCPSALIGVDDKGEVVKMNENHVKFRTRQRITADGGRSRLAGEMS